MDGVNNYSCSCLPGFNGDRCETGRYFSLFIVVFTFSFISFYFLLLLFFFVFYFLWWVSVSKKVLFVIIKFCDRKNVVNSYFKMLPCYGLSVFQ